VGEFKDGLPNGQGTLTFTDGSKYVGGFEHDNFSGQGIFTNADGDRYVGEFKAGQADGRGTLYGPDGGIKQSGRWKDAKWVHPPLLTAITQ
jgi:hypothetical protein